MKKCPHCGKPINIGSILGATTSSAKAKAARKNGKLGGWPKGRPRKPVKTNENHH